jgi:hypothetical protein
MAKKMFGSLRLMTASELQFADSDDSHSVKLHAPSLTADVSFILPAVDAAGVMKSDGSGNLSLAKLAAADFATSAGNADKVLSFAASTGVPQIAKIVDANVDAAAGIVESKLALDYSTSSLNSAIGGKAALAGDTFTGDIALANQKAIKFFEATGGGTNFVSFNAPAALAADNAYVLPVAFPAVSGYALVSSDAGTMSWAAVPSISALATKALDNLASVAINTSLISDTDATDDLGSAAIAWANGYINKLILDSNSQSTTIVGSPSASASVDYVLPAAAPGANGYVLASTTAGVMSWVANSSMASYKTDWALADGATKTVTHNLNSLDVIVQIYDLVSGSQVNIEIDEIKRTSVNAISVTASEAPAASGWRVLVLQV